ncbi:MAG: argininosuccinate lyase, partial [Pseudomonadota bacterium]|nr:argininosuccinate lyase [Pseudomonadota bacterium]
MSKLWEKGYELNQIVETFMTGDDPALDLKIAKYDCIASAAHAKMLASIKIITQEECGLLVDALDEILLKIENSEFVIHNDDEDIHTAIENYLTHKLGDTGKKIHTARSRNDQVLTALRLYMKDQIKVVIAKLTNMLDVLLDFAKKYQNIPYV